MAWAIDGMEERKRIDIHIGGVYGHAAPSIVRTIVGSCISVCLRDPIMRVGGMNHFMLPEGDDADDGTATRYGVHAMEMLINRCMRHGAQRERLEAKVFGGGHVLRVNTNKIALGNIQFAGTFLATESIPVISRDTGGFAAREIYFFTDTGRVLIRRLTETGRDDEAAKLAALERKEMLAMRRKRRETEEADDSNVTLF